MVRQLLYCILLASAASLAQSGSGKEYMQNGLLLLKDSFNEAIVNHFDPNSKKFRQQYFIYRQSYAPDKPLVFIYVGGNEPLSPILIPVSLMRLAKSFKAAVAYLEHRYFGESFPTKDVSADTLKNLLTIPQSVEDIRTFGEYLKQYLKSPTLQIVLFGDSYGGALAAWAREKHSDLFIGAVSSSSAFDVKLDNNVYATMEAQDLSNKQLGGSPECLAAVTKAHEDFADLTRSSDGRRQLERKFKVCKNILEDRMNQLAFSRDGELLGMSIQRNNPNCKKDYCDISRVCQKFTKSKDAPLDVMSEIFLTNRRPPPSPPGCFSETFEDYIEMLKSRDYTGEERMSIFIYCRGFGQRQPCTTENNCPWLRTDERLELNVRICGAFGISDQQAKIYVDQVRKEYGGKTLSGATNVFSINGEADPWRSVSITEPKEGIDVYMVPLASHCYWDKNFVKDVYDKTEAVIAKWLKRSR